MRKKLTKLSLILFTLQLLLTGLFAQDEQKAELVVQTGHTGSVRSVAITGDGKTLVSGSDDKTIKFWDVASTKELKTFFLGNSSSSVRAFAISPDGTIVASSKDETIELRNVFSGVESKPLLGHTDTILSIAFSPNGKYLVSSGFDKLIKVWNAETGQMLMTFMGHTSFILSVAVSPDARTMASAGADNTIKLWDVKTGRELKTLSGHKSVINSVAYSIDGKLLASGDSDNAVILWDVASGRKLKEFVGHTALISSVAFSSDGKTLASASFDKTIRLWDIVTYQELATLTEHTAYVTSVAFSPDGKTLISASMDKTIKLWDVMTEQEIKSLAPHTSIIESLAISTDSKKFASKDEEGNFKVWTIADGKLNSVSKDDTGAIREILSVLPKLNRKSDELINLNNRFLIEIGENEKLNIKEAKTNKLLATLIALDKEDWAVVTPDGLFDSSQDARKLMHYVIGLEPIALEQMKDLYYVPGLLQKIFKGDPLPKVELFSKKDLFPEVEFSQPKAGQKNLTIKLRNRGGGIGQVQVLVNGNELVADARDERVRKNPNVAEAEFTVSLENAPFITGEENRIEVVARNISGSLTNRGTSRGVETFMIAGDGREKPTPNFYIIASGISDYTGDNLDLSFAAKDAEDFAKALELGAVNLPGVGKSKVHIRLLTSNGDKSKVKFDVPDAKVTTATKADFQKAFADFSGATTDDVFIVYLAGHGISLNLNQDAMKAGGNTYLYLTQEATTTDRSFLVLKQSREAMTVSSDELKDLMKQNNALKKVLILDTCAAGAVSTSFLARNDLPADQILAMEQLKDSMGFYILMGSSADSVSYEANEFGQGLLTYSLLSAFKGGKLSGENAKIDEIFAYAKQEVPNLAKNIGGIQQPKTITPEISDSFTIGRFTEEVRAKIQLASPKPVYVRPSLRNAELKYDNLKLTKMLTDGLRAESYAMKRGEPSRIAYFEADEITDAIQPVGEYTIEGETLKISVILVKNNQPTRKKIVVTGNADEPEKVIAQLVVAVIKSGEVK